ncbi:DUF6262 family protein [Spongiactinospora sp. 9N601]|uniref:DUF6262 family protein n=1 Tax=Spongiactinospora sp. 9N601 TaxID=3375149 RepID=UPI00379F82F0
MTGPPPSAAPAGDDVGLRQARIAALTATARRKSAAKVKAAEAAIRHLIKTGTPVTFQEVARHAGVSHTFLYGNAGLRARIEHLRRHRPHWPREPAGHTTSARHEPDNVVLALTAEITRLKAAHRAETAALREALEQAHGENLLLRRKLADRGKA